jgi:hypothetical protein
MRALKQLTHTLCVLNGNELQFHRSIRGCRHRNNLTTHCIAGMLHSIAKHEVLSHYWAA